MSMDRQTYSVEEFARVIGLGRNAAYAAVKRGDVRSVRIGGRILVPRTELPRLLGGAQHVAGTPAQCAGAVG